MTLKQKALAHYDRMIEWAKKQPKRGHVSKIKMFVEINETWESDYCIYCNSHKGGTCPQCKLYSIPRYDGRHCCDGLWRIMNSAVCWPTWVKRARKVREYIEKHG